MVFPLMHFQFMIVTESSSTLIALEASRMCFVMSIQRSCPLESIGTLIALVGSLKVSHLMHFQVIMLTETSPALITPEAVCVCFMMNIQLSYPLESSGTLVALVGSLTMRH